MKKGPKRVENTWIYWRLINKISWGHHDWNDDLEQKVSFVPLWLMSGQLVISVYDVTIHEQVNRVKLNWNGRWKLVSERIYQVFPPFWKDFQTIGWRRVRMEVVGDPNPLAHKQVRRGTCLGHCGYRRYLYHQGIEETIGGSLEALPGLG